MMDTMGDIQGSMRLFVVWEFKGLLPKDMVFI